MTPRCNWTWWPRAQAAAAGTARCASAQSRRRAPTGCRPMRSLSVVATTALSAGRRAPPGICRPTNLQGQVTLTWSGAPHGRDGHGLPPVAADRRGGLDRARVGTGRGHAHLHGQHGDGGHDLSVPAAGARSGGLRGAHSRGQRRGHGPAGGPGAPRLLWLSPRLPPPRRSCSGTPWPGATGYDVELRQAWYAADHAAARVRLPLVGTVTLRTGADRTVELTVLRTGTLVELRGLPASYSYWDLYVRATNAGGASAWVETYVSSDAADLESAAADGAARPAQCGGHGGPALGRGDRGHGLPGLFRLPGR